MNETTKDALVAYKATLIRNLASNADSLRWAMENVEALSGIDADLKKKIFDIAEALRG